MPRRVPLTLLIASAACVMASPGGAAAAASQCQQLADAVQQSQCELRESSRQRAAREAAGQGRYGIDKGAVADEPADDLGQRWDKAVEDANRPDLGGLVFSREGALVIGSVWLLLALARERRRMRARARGSSS